VAVRSSRNVYIDFFRGLALWCIFIDHTPGDWLSRATFQHISACDAFELFVLLAGFSVSYAYGAAMVREGAMIASGKILRRAATIYMAHLILFCTLYVEAAWLGGFAAGQTVMDVLGLSELRNFSFENTGALLTFNYHSGLIDILPLYIVLFLGLAIALPLLRFPRLLLSLSFTLYITTYLLDVHIPGMPIGGDIAPYQYFNPLAWQVLLVIGAVLVIEPSLRPLPHIKWDVAAVAIVLAAFGMQVSVYLSRHGHGVATTQTFPWGPVLTWMEESIRVDSAKMDLHPLRLASILAWTWIAYRLAPFYGGWLRRPWATPFILCGRHSLPVFCFGVALAPVGGVWLASWSGAASQVVYNVTGTFSLICVAAIADATKGLSRHSGDHAALARAGSALPIRSNRCVPVPDGVKALEQQ
jgi:hypothetical protein